MTRFAAILLAVGLAACNPRSAPAPTSGPTPNNSYDQAYVLKTYKVSPGHEKTLERLLRGTSHPIQVVSAQGTQTQFVRLNPQSIGEGNLVLSAPLGVHDGVRELIERLEKTPPAKGPASIETTYWIALGWPSKEVAIAPELAEAKPALETLASLGPMRFELLDRIQLSAVDGEEARANGNSVETIKSTASANGDAVQLRLEIKVVGGKAQTGLETSVTVKPGQFGVLGQVGYVPVDQVGAQMRGNSGAATLFYIVRARTLP